MIQLTDPFPSLVCDQKRINQHVVGMLTFAHQYASELREAL